jgi:gluconokinase
MSRSCIDAETAAGKQLSKTVLLLMGVSGSGKTTIAAELQRVLNWPYVDGDDLHPVANIEKMRSGLPLNDQDRLPWLQRIAQWINDRIAAGEPGIITCSNLKRAYRTITVGDRRGITLVYLRGTQDVIADRISRRRHQYMPPALLRSQFETLEEPGEDECPVIVTVHGSIVETATILLKKVAAAQAAVRQ